MKKKKIKILRFFFKISVSKGKVKKKSLLVRSCPSSNKDISSILNVFSLLTGKTNESESSFYSYGKLFFSFANSLLNSFCTAMSSNT